MGFGDWVKGGGGEKRRVPGSFHSLEEAFCLGGTTAQITLQVLFEQMREDGPVLERRLSPKFHLCQSPQLVHAGAGLRFQVVLLSHQEEKRGSE